MSQKALITILQKLAPHRSMATHLSGILQQYEFSDDVVHKIAKVISQALHELRVAQYEQRVQKNLTQKHYKEDLENIDDILLSL